jgi:hypothetical protein
MLAFCGGDATLRRPNCKGDIMRIVITLAAALAVASPLAAQTASTPVPTPAPMPLAPAVRALPAGTQVSLAPMVEINSKRIEEGQRFQFTVVNDVVENGVVVIPRGSIATGVVAMRTGRAIGGKSGKFDIAFESVTANGRTFPLMGVHRQEGKGNTVGALFGSLVVTGRSAVMLPGQIVTAMIKEQTPY